MKSIYNIFDKVLLNDANIITNSDELFSLYLLNLLKEKEKNILVVTSSLYEANKLFSNIQNFTDSSYLFPMDDFLTSEAIAVSPDLMVSRLETLNACVLDNAKKIIVTNLTGYLRFLPTKNVYKNSFIKLIKNNEYNIDTLKNALFNLGYKKETLVTKTGEFGIRGFVIDVFPLGENNPIRLEFFGDTIESIRYFDEETQKSLGEVDSIIISPYSEYILDDYSKFSFDSMHKFLKSNSVKVESIYDYMEDAVVVYKDNSQIMSSNVQLNQEIFEYRNSKDLKFLSDYMFDFDDIRPTKILNYETINNFSSKKNYDSIYLDWKALPKFSENIDLINQYLNDSINVGKTVVIFLKNYQLLKLTKNLTVEYKLSSLDTIISGKVNLVEGHLTNGFIYNDLVVITEHELFNIHTNISKYKTNFKYSSKIKDINKLVVGDFIVHNIHGIGVYNGIKTLENNSLLKDYLEILYLGKDKLYIPVEKIDLISKFSGKDGITPKINKLGGSEWTKTKLRVKNKIRDIADKLLKLYALRNSQKGFAFDKDDEMQVMFDSSFEFKETKDQLTSIEQIKKDMESQIPMDRLLCGDVGYGKTEVAFRAMFKAVSNSKQVLYLCPTTILSDQQYKNAIRRFAEFPVSIGLLNRFTTKKEALKIIKELENGTIDIVFGTHRLLSNDIRPKNLGLLVIDEEQRFGVTHKERIKEYKSNVDVLTLTATPIPRTLQMSMVGIRSLSLIETPPVDRYPIQTYVVEENNIIIRDAIYKELSRNGQVFVLYNRVEFIERKLEELSKLVPEAKIVVAHGQLSKIELENRMKDFIDHKYDILLCSTIIETGIDISNANTLIIHDADKFGLSQLYQIRGRVGRSNKIAYAYLMYNKSKVLTEAAVKRLTAIKEFTELGTGFSIAERDLSIRGAGDILGSEQAGFIDTIGIDLYIRMLNDEVSRLKGEEVLETLEDEKPLINVSTHISNNYVDDDNLKLEIHKLINKIDSYDKLMVTKEELEDRFGKITDDINIYMHEEWFEKLAKKRNVLKVKQTSKNIELIFDKEISKCIDMEKIFVDSFAISHDFIFKMKNDYFVINFDISNLDEHYIYYLIKLLEVITLK